jgi:hypothetical protein
VDPLNLIIAVLDGISHTVTKKLALVWFAFPINPGAAVAVVGVKMSATAIMTKLSIFLSNIYLPFTLIVTLTFWPGFNPVTVAFAELLDGAGLDEVPGFGVVVGFGVGAATGVAFDGTFAAASFAAVATFAATSAAAALFVASALFVTDSVLTATASSD